MMCSIAGAASNAAITRANLMISGRVPTTVMTFSFGVILYFLLQKV
jgi:hypothetical protein